MIRVLYRCKWFRVQGGGAGIVMNVFDYIRRHMFPEACYLSWHSASMLSALTMPSLLQSYLHSLGAAKCYTAEVCATPKTEIYTGS